MSVATWKSKFMVIPAPPKIKKMSWARALRLTLLKWRNLTPEVLKAYEVKLNDRTLYDPPGNSEQKSDVVDLTTESCLLCIKSNPESFSREDIEPRAKCENCPIKKHTGESCHGPYVVFANTSDPSSMIALLEQTLRLQEIKPCPTTPKAE